MSMGSHVDVLHTCCNSFKYDLVITFEIMVRRAAYMMCKNGLVVIRPSSGEVKYLRMRTHACTHTHTLSRTETCRQTGTLLSFSGFRLLLCRMCLSLFLFLFLLSLLLLFLNMFHVSISVLFYPSISPPNHPHPPVLFLICFSRVLF